VPTDRVRELLAVLEAYYDAVPRAAARVEEIGPFALFVNDGPGWPYYARPRRGEVAFDADDVRRVRARQRALGVPESVEWVAETTPGLRAAVLAGGLAVTDHPLMVLGELAPCAPPPGVDLRLVTAADDLALLGAVARVGFAAPGTSVGTATIEDAVRAAAARDPLDVAFERERIRVGRTVMAVALADGAPIAVGGHQPVGSVAEVVGVATLPSQRRSGVGAALTGLLAADARARGVRTVFLSAGDDAVARVYGRVGFARVGTACVAGAG
jgi:N-acetylglutamate synthase-like GNAT family acetyltransferase